MSNVAAPNSLAYGQQGPNDSTSDFATVAFTVRQMMAKLEVMRLVKVLAVTGGGGAIARAGTVKVQPLVNQIDGSGNPTPHGAISGVPWWRLQGGNGAIICDPVVGEIGMVLVESRDISLVKKNRLQSNPGSFRKYNLSDGIYVGAVLYDAPTQYIAFNSDGITISDAHGHMLQWTSLGIVISSDLFVKGEIIKGYMTGDQVTLGQHVHTSGGSGSPTSPPTPGS